MFDSATFIFGEASILPRYHRSYQIDITANKGNIKIYDYSNDLLTKEFDINKEDWEKLLQYDFQSLEKSGENITKGAKGTKTYTLLLKKENTKVYHFRWDSLADVNEATKNLKDLIKSFVKPNVSELVQSTLQ
jgi:hypothetical protein